jgi:thiamine-phosphate pyrophosphorylase
MVRYYITDSRSIGGVDRLVGNIRRLIEAQAVDGIQIREKDLPVRTLLELAATAVRAAQGTGVRILVNSRMDVALAAGAQGLHLPSGMPPASEWRRLAPAGFSIGVSCHTWKELAEARDGGADFAVLGPVFRPLSKAGPAAELLGVTGFGELAGAVAPFPVLALGGITHRHAREIGEAGGAGIAGISLFQTDANPIG